ncbi:hypothetical protein Tco_1082031 [Tanacetum coccineum]|uniref:Reverse transcriptase domain-containing protein n=1 Tax=Tanacetum coccineum TaxID=301880 RepID=A0ABQ5HZA2_9ASTR
MERFENAILKQREEINDRMKEMFGLLKELTTNDWKKRMKMITQKTGDSIERPDRSDAEMPLKEVEKDNEAENETKNEPIKSTEKELTQAKEEEGPVYEVILKKKITKKEDIGGNFEIPCNIGDMKEDEKRPFILGTPFLTTAKAVIKFDKGTITMRSGKSKMSFHRIPKSSCKIERGIKLYLIRRSLEVLRKFHWMILGGRFNQLSHVSSPLLSKPAEY